MASDPKRSAPLAAHLLPVETVQALRETLAAKAAGDASQQHQILALDARRLVHRIIKDEAAEKRLHILATARRFQYCFPRAACAPEPPAPPP